MNLPVNVFLSMINYVVDVFRFQALIGLERVTVNSGTLLYMPFNFAMQESFFVIWTLVVPFYSSIGLRKVFWKVFIRHLNFHLNANLNSRWQFADILNLNSQIGSSFRYASRPSKLSFQLQANRSQFAFLWPKETWQGKRFGRAKLKCLTCTITLRLPVFTPGHIRPMILTIPDDT